MDVDQKALVSRKTDLEQNIRESYQIIHQYELIICTSNPEQKLHARRAIAEHWQLIQGYLAEYRPLAVSGWPEDIAQIAARFVSLNQLITVEQMIEEQEQWQDIFSSEWFEAMQSPLKEIRQTIHTQLWKYLYRLPPPLSIPNNLPQMPGEFVGRERDKARVYEGLASRWPLVCIEGIGGIGKTWLALAVAAECMAVRKGTRNIQGLPLFDGFIWATSREQTLTLDGLLNMIARTLDYPGIIRLLLEDKQSNVRTLLSSKRHLLIVDNLDIVTDPSVYRFLRDLPEPSKALLTSRKPKIESAWCVSLRGLDQDESLRLIQNEVKRLGLTAVVGIKDEMLRLCQATDGTPLAIIWAVSQIKLGLPLEDILGYLHKAQEDILNPIFGQSWQLLSPEAKQVLMAVTLFATSAPPSGVQVISQIHGLNDALGQLIELSLVDVINPMHPNRYRYTTHLLTRAFVNKTGHWDRASVQAAYDRMVAYYEQVLTPPPDQQAGDLYWDGLGSFERSVNLEPERDNLVHLIRSLLEKQQANQALALFLKAVHLLHFWGLWKERLEFGYKLCEVAHAQNNPVEAWLQIDALGYVLRHQDRFDECLKALDAGRKIAAKYSLEEAIILADVFEASVHAKQGNDMNQVVKKVNQAADKLDLRTILKQGTLLQRIIARRVAGAGASLERRRKNWSAAKEWYQIELEFRQLVHDNLAPSWSGLAGANLELGDIKAAEDCLCKAIKTAGQQDKAWVYYEGARLAEKKGNLRKALRRAVAALDLFRRLGQKNGMNRCEALLHHLREQQSAQGVREN